MRSMGLYILMVHVILAAKPVFANGAIYVGE